jgi:hypothetical protein
MKKERSCVGGDLLTYGLRVVDIIILVSEQVFTCIFQVKREGVKEDRALETL